MKDPSEGLLGHDVVKVLTTDFPTICGSSLQHFFQFLDVHGLSQFFGNSANVGGIDMS